MRHYIFDMTVFMEEIPVPFPHQKTTLGIKRKRWTVPFVDSNPYFFTVPHAANDRKDEAASKTTAMIELLHCEAGNEDL